MKFKLEINMDNKRFKNDPLVILSMLLADVSERLDAQWMVQGVGEGIIWDNDNNPIGSFGIRD